LSRLRTALTFENVLVTVVAFVVLAGGSAYAASQLAKNSVGTKQLKKNSVTAKKIRKNAVTAAKIKKAAVNGAKVKDGSLGPSKLNMASMPFSHVVAESRGSGAVAIPNGLESNTPYPIDPPFYTQEAGRLDTFIGSLDVSFAPGCGPPRYAQAFVLRDAPSGALPSPSNVAAAGAVLDEGTGPAAARASLSMYEGGGGTAPPPGAAINRALSVVVIGFCAAGSGITATGATVKVVGVR
jgi:hypothetical protein